MWGAIKSDLLSFVTTITDDTTKTINRVLGEEEGEEEDVSVQEKLVADLRRSFETYSTPIRENDIRDYERFKKKFNLSSCAADIARVLDEEPEVSRFYAELVPIVMPPEEFWGRLFFRINQIYRNGGANLDDDDEEELVWEEEEFTSETPAATEEKSEDSAAPAGATRASSSQTAGQPSADMGTSTHVSTTSKGAQTTANSGAQGTTAQNVDVSEIISVNEHMKTRVEVLEEENRRLVSQEEELFRRIQELEARLAAQAIADQQEAEEQEQISSATTTPQSKRSVEKRAVPATTPPTAAYHNATTPPTAAPSANPSAKKKGSTAKKLFDSPSQQPQEAVPAEDAHFADNSPAVQTGTGEQEQNLPPAVAATKKSSTKARPAAPAQTAAAPVSVTVPVPAVALSDHLSLSSEESGVVVNKSDANSLYSVDDDAAPLGGLGNAGALSPSTTGSAGIAASGGAGTGTAGGVSPGKSAFSSQETAKYLAALDDQDEEEDGWN